MLWYSYKYNVIMNPYRELSLSKYSFIMNPCRKLSLSKYSFIMNPCRELSLSTEEGKECSGIHTSIALL